MTNEDFITTLERFKKDLIELTCRYGMTSSCFHGMLRDNGKLKNVSFLLENETLPDNHARFIIRVAFDAGITAFTELLGGEVLHENIEYTKHKPGEMPH